MDYILFRIRVWYYNHIKYHMFTPTHRKFLIAFEQGIRARKEVDTVSHDILRLNIHRAECIFKNDFQALVQIDKLIKELGDDYEEAVKEHEQNDMMLWRQVFANFISIHDDQIVSKVWGAPVEQVVKFRAALVVPTPK